MDRELQKTILTVIKENKGSASLPTLKTLTMERHWGLKQISDESVALILHQLKLLEKEEKILDEERTANHYYILLPAGYRVLESWHKKLWHFFLYDKNNLFVILSLLISAFSLYISFSIIKTNP